jgi:hypothetical protein
MVTAALVSAAAKAATRHRFITVGLPEGLYPGSTDRAPHILVRTATGLKGATPGATVSRENGVAQPVREIHRKAGLTHLGHLGHMIGALPTAFTLCIGRSMLQIPFGEPSFYAHAWPDSLLSVP